MVATIAEKGYEQTTVADLVNLSGVSRSAFYRQFDDKQACFLAAIETIIEPALATLEATPDTPRIKGARKAFDSLIELIASSRRRRRCASSRSTRPAPRATSCSTARCGRWRKPRTLLDGVPGAKGCPQR